MDLSDVLRSLRTRWKGAFLILVLGVGATVFFTLQQPKVYAADADALITAVGDGSSGVATLNDQLAKSRVASYLTLATSRTTAQRAIDMLGLQASPAGLIGSISVEIPADTAILRITATSSTPEGARDLAETWVVALGEQIEEVEAPGDVQSPIRVRNIQSAELPGAPISPNVRNNVAAGGVLSLMLALGYALLFAYFDRRIRSSAEIEKSFKSPVVGSVPALDSKTRDRGVVLGTAQDASKGWGASEAFRKLRTNLAYMDVDNPPRVIVVTSPNQGEGKSTVAINLAAAIGASGEPVVLVDSDLRRPSAAASLGVDDAVGLTSVLIGQVSLLDALQPHPQHENLTVLASGSVPPNPSELLASKAMGGLLRELALTRIVVVDAPPVLPVTDASVLTRQADGAIVVVHYGSTLDLELGSSLSQLAAVQGRVLGVVINRVPRGERGYYYRRYYQTDGGRRGSRSLLRRTKDTEKAAQRGGGRRRG